MNPLQLMQYLALAEAAMSLIGKTAIHFGSVSAQVAAAQKDGRSLSNEEWKAIVAPSQDAIDELQATIAKMRELKQGKVG